MTASHDMTLEAHRLQAQLRTRPRDGATRLLAFAERYAVSPREIDDAALLRMESTRLLPPDEARGLEEDEATSDTLDDLVHRMTALVERIVHEHLREAGGEAAQNRQAVMIQLREHYQRLAPTHETFFRCTGLEKRYGADFQLGRLDLSLRLGEITGVVGQNGHGKTTLLRLVAGDLLPDEGTVDYPTLGQGGDRIHWRAVKTHIAMVPQELPAWRGYLENTLRFEASLHGLRGSDNDRAVAFIVERLGLGDHLDKRWSELSGGYKLRFALARALVWKPRLLVMDEPLANLDIKAKGLLLQDVRDLARSFAHPIAVIMSSHDLHNLETICNQMVFLQGGQVQFVGGPQALGADRRSNEYEVGSSFSLAEVREALAGGPLADVRQDGLTLIIRTAPDLTPSTVLSVLLSRGIDVSYFRDNSHSLRRFFQ